MHPFIHIFGFSIPAYGIMTALAYCAGLYYCYKQQAKLGLAKDKIFDISEKLDKSIMDNYRGSCRGENILYLV